MIRITTDRAIRRKMEEIREREFEKRLIHENFERIDERIRKLEHEIDELRWGKLSEVEE